MLRYTSEIESKVLKAAPLPLAEPLEERCLLSVIEVGAGITWDLAGVGGTYESITVEAGGSLVNSGNGVELTTSSLDVAGSIDIPNSQLSVTDTGLISGTGSVAASDIVIDGTLTMTDAASLAPFMLTIHSGGTLDVSGLAGGYVLPGWKGFDAGGTILGSFNTGEGTLMTIGGASPATVYTQDLTLGAWSWNSFEFIDGGYDRIIVNGTVAVNGMFAVEIADNGLAGPFVVIENDGTDAVTGTFEGLPNQAGGSTVMVGDTAFQLFYTYDSVSGSLTDGNDVALVIPGEPPTGEPPVAGNDEFQGQMNTPLTIQAADLLANDYDPDGTPLQIIAVSPAETHGTVILNADGTITYTPDADYFGAANFNYTIEDTDGQTASAFVYIYIQPPAQLSGWVFLDFTNDGLFDTNESPLAGVAITLTGQTDAGEAVWDVQHTDSDGQYAFTGLPSGTYQIAQTQPEGLVDGIDTIGSLGGVVGLDSFSDIRLQPGEAGINYNFSEQATVVQQGQAAPIGFWQNKKGQALILSLNGGATATALGDWLASTLPGTFGQLAGATNAEVAEHYKSLFRAKGGKLAAHLMATALSVYATTESLGGQAGAAYGFTTSTYGLALSVYNVGASGTAFGVGDYTTLAVSDILQATDSRTIDGMLYGGDTTLQNLAQIVFGDINSDGSIG